MEIRLSEEEKLYPQIQKPAIVGNGINVNGSAGKPQLAPQTEWLDKVRYIATTKVANWYCNLFNICEEIGVLYFSIPSIIRHNSFYLP